MKYLKNFKELFDDDNSNLPKDISKEDVIILIYDNIKIYDNYTKSIYNISIFQK